MNAPALLVWGPFPDMAAARQTAAHLIPQGLVACVYIFPEGESHYVWQGKQEQSAEIMTVWKTTPDRWEALSQKLAELHPYDVPAILATPVTAGYPPYLPGFTNPRHRPEGRDSFKWRALQGKNAAHFLQQPFNVKWQRQQSFHAGIAEQIISSRHFRGLAEKHHRRQGAGGRADLERPANEIMQQRTRQRFKMEIQEDQLEIFLQGPFKRSQSHRGGLHLTFAKGFQGFTRQPADRQVRMHHQNFINSCTHRF